MKSIGKYAFYVGILIILCCVWALSFSSCGESNEINTVSDNQTNESGDVTKEVVADATEAENVTSEVESEADETENVVSDSTVAEESGDKTENDVFEEHTEDTKVTQVSVDTDAGTEIETEDANVKPVYVPVTGITLTVYEVSLQVGESQMPIVTMFPANATDVREIWESSDESVAKVDRYGNITALSVGQCVVKVTSADNGDVSASVNVIVKENAECTYIDGILVVNKTYALPKNYAPGWDAQASAKLNEMIAAAKNEGYTLWVLCGYRSYIDQYIIYNGYVARDGQQAADRYSARPGHSEHQTGLAFDLNSLMQDFGDTPEGKWLAQNCHKYGFIIRYPKEKESITGYMYEPWHVRYLGVEKAKEVFESGLCLEEFLGITSSYS